jgi:hypothetical protein
MVFYLIFYLGNYLSGHNFNYEFPKFKNLILKRATKIKNKICHDSAFFITMETLSHILWHAINKHEEKIIYNYEKTQRRGPKNII